MAEAHSPKPVKEKVEEEGSKDKEEKKGEKKKRRRKPNPPPSSISISIPDRPSPYSLLNDKNSGCGSFSQLLAGAMASPATPNSGSPAVLEMKPTIVLTLPVDPSRFPVVAQPAFIGVLTPGQFGMSHQEALASVTAQAQLQLQAGFPPSPLTIPTKSLIEPLLSAFSPTPLQQRMPSVSEDHVSKSEVDQHANSDQKRQNVHGIVKTPSGDGFNWRKYGQKQVKSSESSRSYYRCTHANCSAKKKVERSHDGNINEIIYKSQHNHEPPHKIRCKKDSEPPFGGPSGGNETVESPAEDIRESNPSTPKREHSSNYPTPESQLQSSTNCHGNAGTLADEDQCDEREPKRRIKENTVASSPSLLKTLKEPKVVVQTGSDSGSLGDGYRWRKYGQKIVKGNPHPRSYYKCTYVGCPVRKHVERASDDEKAHIITYEGKHNHDPPASKDSHDPSTLISDATPVSTSGQSKTSNLLPDETTSTRSPSHVEGKLAGGKASELGGEKTFESAQTLLSIGFNSNSSEEDAGTKNPNAIQQPLFNENSAAVSV